MTDKSQTVECGCGAFYVRRIVSIAMKDIGSFECSVCGHRMETWCGNDVPVYKLIAEPRMSKRA